MRWVVFLALGAMLAGSASAAATQCGRLLARLADQVADAVCAESTDLTTNNPERRRPIILCQACHPSLLRRKQTAR